jgi:hypothetical protein
MSLYENPMSFSLDAPKSSDALSLHVVIVPFPSVYMIARGECSKIAWNFSSVSLIDSSVDLFLDITRLSRPLDLRNSALADSNSFTYRSNSSYVLSLFCIDQPSTGKFFRILSWYCFPKEKQSGGGHSPVHLPAFGLG